MSHERSETGPASRHRTWARVPVAVAVTWLAVLLLAIARAVSRQTMPESFDLFMPLSILFSTYTITKSMPVEKWTRSTRVLFLGILLVGIAVLALRLASVLLDA